MKTTTGFALQCRFGAVLAGLAILGLATGSAHAGPVKVLQFTADAGHLNGGSLTLDHPALNGKATLKPIVTQNYTDTYNNHQVGLAYIPGATAAAGRWTIFNEDSFGIPVGAKFNLLIPTAGVKVDTTPLNSVNDVTALPVAKGKPLAFLHFSHMLNPYPALEGFTRLKAVQSLVYGVSANPKNPLYQRWCLNSVDASPAIVTRYFVFDSSKLPNNVLHRSSLASTAANYTRITDAGAINSPTAVVFITTKGAAITKPLGVFFNGIEWAIFTQDGATAIPVGYEFNVLYFPAPIP